MFRSPDSTSTPLDHAPLLPEMYLQSHEEFADATQVIDAIIGIVRDRTGVDFSLYRLATIQRRIGNRMISVGAPSLGVYLARLRTDAGEAMRLLERLTIKVSRFYRNVRTFDFLLSDVFPLLAKSRGGAPLRIWSAGCGRGEEAYTLAMLLHTAGIAGTVEATDIDPEALVAARAGVYRIEALTELPQHLANEYLESFEQNGEVCYRVCAAVRAAVNFSHHDLTALTPRDTTASFDLICCRNVSIYLGRDAQQRAFELLNAKLVDGAFLCIGEAEWPLPEVASELTSLGHKTQVFRRVGRTQKAAR